MAQRYPLSWPAGWARTARSDRARARFHSTRRVNYSHSSGSYQQKQDLTISGALNRLLPELRRLGVQDGDAIISTNVRVRLDGLPYSNDRPPEDPGVAVYFRLKGQARVLACDTWDRVADNLAAAAAHIEALRAIERYGVGSLDQAFAGYAALPAKGEAWRSVLGFAEDESVNVHKVEAAFKRGAMLLHPDKPGGSHEAFTALTGAKADALAAIREIA